MAELVNFRDVLQLLYDKLVVYTVPLVFLLCPHPNQYYHHWRHTASASQSWVFRSLLVTGNDGAFSVAGELLAESLLCCLMAVLSGGMIEASLWRGHRLFTGSSSGDCPVQEKIYWMWQKFLLAFLLLRTPFSVGPVTGPVRDKLIGRF